MACTSLPKTMAARCALASCPWGIRDSGASMPAKRILRVPVSDCRVTVSPSLTRTIWPCNEGVVADSAKAVCAISRARVRPRVACAKCLNLFMFLRNEIAVAQVPPASETGFRKKVRAKPDLLFADASLGGRRFFLNPLTQPLHPQDTP